MTYAKYYFCVAALSSFICADAQNRVNLPVVNLAGKEYYAYKVKGGDSVYGICKKYGWDEKVIHQYNTGSEVKIKKGQMLYYPTGNAVATATEPAAGRRAAAERTPVNHTVKRGETVYGIANLYGVSVDDVYDLNPQARTGIKAGASLIIPQKGEVADENAPFFYTVKPGDTLFSLAQKFHSSVESIMAQNPGVSEQNFKADTNIKITPNTAQTVQTVQEVERRIVNSFGSYEVKKDDTWASVAAASGVSEQELRNANSKIAELKKGEWLTIPQTSAVKVEETVITLSPQDATLEGRDAVYDKLHNVSEKGIVNVSVVLEKPSKKSNIDFLRGFLMGVDKQKNAGYKINLHVVDASSGADALAQDSLLTASNLIIGVYDNDFPTYLSDLGRSNGTEVVNVFDTKNQLYTQNPQMIQLLQPLDHFNEVEAQYFIDKFGNAKLVFAGTPDTTDQFAKMLADGFDANNVTYVTDEELPYYPFEGTARYLVYPYARKKDGIESALDALAKIREEYPAARISTIGQPVWIAYAESLGEKMGASDTYIPSRFFMRPDGDEMTEFASQFKEMYKTSPVKSYPQYSLVGYDVANYFLPTTAGNGGDYNTGVLARDGVQNDIDLKRLNAWSGFVNANDYVIHITPMGNFEKITVQ